MSQHRLKRSLSLFHSLLSIAVLLLTIPTIASGQAGDASISGRVSDPAGRVVQYAEVSIKNVATDVATITVTNQAGIYTFPSLPPGEYVLTLHKQGFQSVDLVGLTLYTQDRLERNFALSVGSASESVTVNGGTTNESPAVSMTVDREFVENIPLNGRSFQDLIQLAPGTASDKNGNYSIDGQRTDDNYYTVDGVSATLGGALNDSAASGGALSGYASMQTVLGTTQGIAAVDSLQEFTIQTSGYAAEYGRSPGGQVQFSTRAGTNEVHGTLFNYFRNTIFDANSYPNDYNDKPKTAEHQNDFGGTVGGPVSFPHLYNGKDRTFYFLSYEGLRLLLPSSETEYVPTQAFRNAVSSNVQPFVDAVPLPNESTPGDACTVSGTTISLTGPTAPTTTPCDEEFFYAYSYPNNLDNYSGRLDHRISDRLHAFLRYSDTPSSLSQGVESVEHEAINTHTWTLGLTADITKAVLNELRFNYSRDGEEAVRTLASVGGSVPFNRDLLIPSQYDSAYAYGGAIVRLSPSVLNIDAIYNGYGSVQHQYQVVDSVAWTHEKHVLKVGADWRRLAPNYAADAYEDLTELTTVPAIQQGYASVVEITTSSPTSPIFDNFSVYAQDHWSLRQKLSVDYGLRWEFNPPPGPANGQYPAALTSSNLAIATVAPLGTQPYQTQYDKLAPRFGFAWNALPSRKFALTVRGGFGIFYTTGQTSVADEFTGSYPFSVTNPIQTNVQFPLPTSVLKPTPPSATLVAPYPYSLYLSPDITLPYVEEWSLSVDEALNARNTLTASYVGNNGKRLPFSQYFTANPDGNTNFPNGVNFANNASSSNYNGLQIQDVGRIVSGLDVVSSFTYAHALDNVSTDTGTYPPQWGNSVNDLRRILNVALNYQSQAASWRHWDQAIGHGWLLASRFTAESGYPIDIVQTVTLAQGTEIQYSPDLVSGVPIYLHGHVGSNGAALPGNWSLNRAAFACTTTGATSGSCTGTPTRLGTLGRDYVRTPSFWALNTAVQRSFPLYDELRLNFRAEAFNVFNHPNFGSPITSLSASTFGEILGSSGVATIGSPNQLYAMGAARSLQLSLNLRF